jgi:hypothetical protein
MGRSDIMRPSRNSGSPAAGTHRIRVEYLARTETFTRSQLSSCCGYHEDSLIGIARSQHQPIVVKSTCCRVLAVCALESAHAFVSDIFYRIPPVMYVCNFSLSFLLISLPWQMPCGTRDFTLDRAPLLHAAGPVTDSLAPHSLSPLRLYVCRRDNYAEVQLHNTRQFPAC